MALCIPSRSSYEEAGIADINVQGINGEFRRPNAGEIGMIIRALRADRGIKRASLAADAAISEKTLERAEAGQSIREMSHRRIARALGLREDAFLAELYVPALEEAALVIKRQQDEQQASYQRESVKGI